MHSLSIVVPCYNEAKNIPLLLERFAAVIGQRPVEVILVDNGSSDTTRVAMQECVPRHAFARSVFIDANQGYGGGIIKGLNEAKGDYIGWTHADLQTDPADVMAAYDLLKEANFAKDILIKGARQGRPLFDQFFTVGMSMFESMYLKAYLWDINAQPNIFPREFFYKWNNPPVDFALDLYVFYMARQAKMRIVRLNVDFPGRRHGVSSWNTGLASKWKFIRRTLLFSKTLKRSLANDPRRSPR